MVGLLGSGETRNLAEFSESEWSLVNSPWSLKLPKTKNDDGHLLELTGPQTVSVLPFSIQKKKMLLLKKKKKKEENAKDKKL